MKAEDDAYAKNGSWGVLGEAAGFLLVLARAVVTASRFFGTGGVSDSSERTMGRLSLGLAGARLRFREGLGMSRWIQRWSANVKD